MATIRKLPTSNVGKEMAQQDSYTPGGNVKCIHFGKQLGNFFKSKYISNI